MPRFLQEQDLRKELIRLLKQKGSQSSLAREIGISSSYLNDVLRGKRQITERIAGHLGYKRSIVFTRISI
jgi:plasmid maintenance system antidote protein VapI